MSNGFQAGVRLGLVDGLLDRRIEETLDGRVEVVERDQDADFVDGDGLRRRLEGVEHGPLATGQVHTRGPGLADRLEDFLEQLELVRGERVVLDEILAVLELAEGHAAVLEGQLVLEDVALLLEHGFEFGLHVRHLCQQAGLDHFIDVGAGERQRRVEPALNLREVLLLGLAHLAQHGVHVFLGRDDDPGPATADRPQLLGDRLQVEHQVGVGADELADFIDQEDEPVLRPLGVQVLLDPLAEVLDGQGEVVLGPVDPLFRRLPGSGRAFR